MASFERFRLAGISSDTKSEYQPWLLEFQQMDMMLRAAHDTGLMVRMGSQDHIKQYYAILYEIYMAVKPYMSYGMKKLFRGYNKLIKTMIDEWEFEQEEAGIDEFPDKMVRKLTYYHEALLVAKHKLGLSIPMHRTVNY